MKSTTKWIIGILIGLVVLACVATAGIFIFARYSGANMMMGQRMLQPFEHGRVVPWRDMPMQPFNQMPGRSFRGIIRPNWIVGGVFLLGLLFLAGLVVAVVVLLARRSGRSAPVNAAAAASVTPAAADLPVSPMRCPNCGREINADWQHCAYCGTNLTLTI